MRIKGVHLAGLAAVLTGAAAEEALANDLSISTATTTPVATSAPDGVSPGDVTITTSGSIAITTGAAVTIDSDNSVTNNGNITSSDSSNTTGILIGGGYTGDVTNTGTIGLTETYAITDSDSDGDFDGDYAQGSGRRAIWLQSAGTLTGDIINSSSSTLNIEGNSSAGIDIDGTLDGDLSALGTIGVLGDDSAAISIDGAVTGDVIVAGTVSARGENAVGVNVNGAIGGQLSLGGSLAVTGYHSSSRPALQSVLDKLDADDLLQSGSAVAVHASVGGGILIRGTGVEDDKDDDGDGVTEEDGDSNDDLSAAIAVAGGAPAILVRPDAAAPSNVVLGATASGFGLHNRGAITASGVYDGFTGTAIQIEGAGGATVSSAGGVLNDGTMTVTAYEADGRGLVIGNGATAPQVINRGKVNVTIRTDADDTAYGALFQAGANVGAVNNSGTFNIIAFGEDANAVAIEDRSNTVTSITNSGAIVAQLVVIDEDFEDGVTPTANGDAIAIDLSGNSVGATINQIADIPFTDDDDVDNDAASRPAVQMRGDVRLGSGADAFNLLSGTLLGDISFGAGADSLRIDNGAVMVGSITDSDGALTIDVVDGTLVHTGGETQLTSAHFGAGAELGVLISPTAGESSLLEISGVAEFEPGAVVTPVLPVGLPESTPSRVFLTAGSLVGADNVVRSISGGSYLYNVAVTTATVNTTNDSLAASFVLKSTTELGLNANETAAFNPIIVAMRTDSEAGAALASLSTADEFFFAYDQLMPNYSSAAAEIATTAISQGQAASSNRLARTRMADIKEPSVWVQEIAYGLSRDPKDFGVEYRGSGFGFGAGIDAPLNNGAIFGMSTAFVASSVEEPDRSDGEISAWFAQLNGYFGTGLGPINLDLIGGAGAGKMESARKVDIGDDFSRIANGEWWAYEGHAMARASAPLRMGSRFVVTPRMAVTYVGLFEDAYVEENGGSGINLDVDKTDTQRLWGDVGVDFSWRFGRGRSSIEPHISYAHRLNIIKDASERTLRFASGGEDFTLVDEKPGNGGPVVGMGIDSTNGFSTISLQYEGEFGEEIERHSLNAAVRFRF